jgi:hypothetical protein
LDRCRLQYLPVAKAWKIATHCQSRTPMLLKTQSCSRQLGRSWSLAIIHTPRLCDDKAPDVAAYHLEVQSWDWPSESSTSRLVVRWYVRETGNLSAAMETDSGQQLLPEGIEHPTGPYFCVPLGSRSICPGGSTKVDCGIGRTSHARTHISPFFWRYASSGKHRVYFSF